MDKLFEQYKFTKTWEEDNKMFYVNTDKNIVSYFILNFIDCTNILDNEELIRAELEKLEEEYIETESDKKGIKYSIINSFKTMQEISQIDKNTSAIYLVKFSEENMLTNLYISLHMLTTTIAPTYPSASNTRSKESKCLPTMNIRTD